MFFRSWKSLWIYKISSCVIMKQPNDCKFLNCWQQFPQSSLSPWVRWCVTGVTVLLSAVRSVGSPKPRSAGEGLTRALFAVVEDTHSHTGKTSTQTSLCMSCSWHRQQVALLLYVFCLNVLCGKKSHFATFIITVYRKKQVIC